MRLIKPVEITPAKLISSNVPETDYPAWLASATYAMGDRVLLEHHIYEALAAVPAGVKPGEEVVTPESPAKWQDLGMDNRWRMFDNKVESLTTNPGTIEVTIRPGAVVNSLALFNLKGKLVAVSMVDAIEGEVYRKEISLVDAGVDNWYDWFFEPIGRRTDLVVLDMPAYGSADIVVTIDAGSATAAAGHIVIGSIRSIGTALYGSSVGINDYSRKSTDEFGNTVVIQRSFSNRAEFDVSLETSDVTRVRRLLAELRATPVVWIGEETYEATILFGFYKDFQIVFSGPTVSDCSITVEGVYLMATPPVIPDLPPAPTRGDGSADFTPKADAMIAALQPMVTAENALGAWMNTTATQVSAAALFAGQAADRAEAVDTNVGEQVQAAQTAAANAAASAAAAEAAGGIGNLAFLQAVTLSF